jgi:type III pantothenate kinase
LEFEKRGRIHFISHDDVFPFVNGYETPKTLGIDRMVLAAGTTLQFRGKIGYHRCGLVSHLIL